MNAEFWDREAGAVWAALVDRMDPPLAPFGEAALAALDPRPGTRAAFSPSGLSR